MNTAVLILVSLASGFCASLGLGGGMILLVYLTAVAGVPQLNAQGINLLFFLPIAFVSLIIHSKAGLVKWKKLMPAIISGCISAGAFSLIADRIGSEYIQKAFAVILIIAGTAEVFKKKKS